MERKGIPFSYNYLGDKFECKKNSTRIISNIVVNV